jgi:hypothetical protein
MQRSERNPKLAAGIMSDLNVCGRLGAASPRGEALALTGVVVRYPVRLHTNYAGTMHAIKVGSPDLRKLALARTLKFPNVIENKDRRWLALRCRALPLPERPPVEVSK